MLWIFPSTSFGSQGTDRAGGDSGLRAGCADVQQAACASICPEGKRTQKFAAFLLGFNALGRSRTLLWSFLLSLFYLLFQVVPIYALAHGYGVHLSIFAATTVLIILRLGTVVPQGPGNVGVTQAVLVLGLSLFGVDRNTATGLATVLFAVITVPLVVTGFIAFLITGMRLRDVFDRTIIEAHRR